MGYDAFSAAVFVLANVTLECECVNARVKVRFIFSNKENGEKEKKLSPFLSL